jgi:hypothetical protein
MKQITTDRIEAVLKKTLKIRCSRLRNGMLDRSGARAGDDESVLRFLGC